MMQNVKILSQAREAQGSCDHASIESLGSNANVRFSRCQGCGYVLVRQGKRVWAIPPVEKVA